MAASRAVRRDSSEKAASCFSPLPDGSGHPPEKGPVPLAVPSLFESVQLRQHGASQKGGLGAQSPKDFRIINSI